MLEALIAFLSYFGVSVAAAAAFILIYCMITPYHERELLAKGNNAAALSLAGVAVGFTLPVASAVAHSVSLIDLSIWAAIAGVVQLIGYTVFRFLFPAMRAQIETGQMALPTLYAGLALSLGMLNAAAMSY